MRKEKPSNVVDNLLKARGPIARPSRDERDKQKWGYCAV